MFEEAEEFDKFSVYKKLPYNEKLKDRAKALRKAGVLSEVLFWKKIKAKQFFDIKFYRQKIIGNYIVDFYAPQLNLIIEIDGYSHYLKDEYDAKRENYFKELGIRTIHFEDVKIKKDIDNVFRELEGYYLRIMEDKENTPS